MPQKARGCVSHSPKARRTGVRTWKSYQTCASLSLLFLFFSTHSQFTLPMETFVRWDLLRNCWRKKCWHGSHWKNFRKWHEMWMCLNKNLRIFPWRPLFLWKNIIFDMQWTKWTCDPENGVSTNSCKPSRWCFFVTPALCSDTFFWECCHFTWNILTFTTNYLWIQKRSLVDVEKEGCYSDVCPWYSVCWFASLET